MSCNKETSCGGLYYNSQMKACYMLMEDNFDATSANGANGVVNDCALYTQPLVFEGMIAHKFSLPPE